MAGRIKGACFAGQEQLAASKVVQISKLPVMLFMIAACCSSVAQITGTNLQQGEPIVTTDSTHANSSAAGLDATQFSGSDPCAKIAAACAFATGLNPSIGMDVDARAFASNLGTSNTNQMCSTATANAMLTSCTNGGKVLLGPYTLWLPLNPTAGAAGSPPGAVLVLPNNFGGFRGISRGSLSCHDANANCTAANTPTSTGTVIAACTGNNLPISGCTAPSTSRQWSISSISITAKSNTNYYGVTLATGSATNLVAGEPVRIDQGSTAGFNGAWRICSKTASNVVNDSNCPADPPAPSSSCSGSSCTFYVTGLTPAPTACSSSCGTLYGEIPLIDIGPGGSPTFAQRVENLTIDCVGVATCVPIRSLTGNEQSGFRDVQLTGSLERAFDVHTLNAQNGGPMVDIQIAPGTKIGNNSNQAPCGAGTTGFFVGENGFRSLGGNVTVDMANCAFVWAPGGNVSGPVTAGAYVNTSQLTFEIGNLHCENTEKCIIVGQDTPSIAVNIHDSDGMISNSCKDSMKLCIAQTGAYAGGPASVIDISPNFASTASFTGHYKMSNLKKSNVAQNLIEDNILLTPNFLTDKFLEAYDVDRDCSVTPCKNTLLTTSTSVQSTMPTGFSIPQGTLAASSPFINQSATWNSGSTAFTNFQSNITNTSSALGSLLVNEEVNSTPVWTLDPVGDTTQAGNLSLTGSTPTISSSATDANLNLVPNGAGVVTAPSLNLTGSTPTISSGATNASLNLVPNGSGLVTAPTPTSPTDNSTDVATTAFVQAHLPHIAGGVELTGQTSSIPSTTLVPTPGTGTYMLSLCVWVQTTASKTITATVSYNNGTIATSDSSTAVSASSTSNRSCTVISEHIASGTAVTYSTTVTPAIGGTYGLDIVETQVQ